jgi:hypothetical protein
LLAQLLVLQLQPLGLAALDLPAGVRGGGLLQPRAQDVAVQVRAGHRAVRLHPQQPRLGVLVELALLDLPALILEGLARRGEVFERRNIIDEVSLINHLAEHENSLVSIQNMGTPDKHGKSETMFED